MPPAQFARLLGAAGHYYREALLGVERNNHGHSVLNTLMNEVQYTNLYRHVDYHDPYNYGQLPGWPTNAKTKPVMVDDLDEAISEGHLRIHSADLVRECLTYVVDDAGATGAQPGHHDDRVIAAAIAWQLRKRPRPQLQIARAGPPQDGRPSKLRKRTVFRVVKDGPDRGRIIEGGGPPLMRNGWPVEFR